MVAGGTHGIHEQMPYLLGFQTFHRARVNPPPLKLATQMPVRHSPQRFCHPYAAPTVHDAHPMEDLYLCCYYRRKVLVLATSASDQNRYSLHVPNRDLDGHFSFWIGGSIRCDASELDGWYVVSLRILRSLVSVGAPCSNAQCSQ